MMTSAKPSVTRDGHYGVTEASKALGISRKTLAKYVDEGLLTCRVSKRTGRKVFTGEALTKCWERYYFG